MFKLNAYLVNLFKKPIAVKGERNEKQIGQGVDTRVFAVHDA